MTSSLLTLGNYRKTILSFSPSLLPSIAKPSKPVEKPESKPIVKPVVKPVSMPVARPLIQSTAKLGCFIKHSFLDFLPM